MDAWVPSVILCPLGESTKFDEKTKGLSFCDASVDEHGIMEFLTEAPGSTASLSWISSFVRQSLSLVPSIVHFWGHERLDCLLIILAVADFETVGGNCESMRP